MSDIRQTTAAPIPWTIGGRVFYLSPLHLVELGELTGWVVSRGARAALLAMGDIITPEERREIIQESLYPSRHVDMGVLTQSPDQLVYLLWISARKNEPTLTLDEFAPYIELTEKTIEELQTLVDALATGGPVDKGEDDESNPPESSGSVGPQASEQ